MLRLISQPIKSLMWLCASVIFVAGCAGQATRINSLSFQKGQGLSNEQILLGNIIAAANQRTPTFVAANQVSSGVDATGSLSGTITFPDTVDILNPMVSGHRSQNVTILDYGATKAAQYLYAAVDNTYLRQLAFQGWNLELIDTILEAGIYIHPDLQHLINLKFHETCNTPSSQHMKDECNWVSDKIKSCGDPFEENSYAFTNAAQSVCEFYQFQIILVKLYVTGVNWAIREAYDKDGKVVVDKNGKPQENVVPFIKNQYIERAYDSLEEEWKKRKEKTAPVLALFLRSPAQIIEFLGRLAAMQLYGDPPLVVEIPTWEGRHLIPFRVVRGSDLDGPSAVSVRSAFGSYHVPQPLPPDRDHESLRVMALVIELQNRARQEAPIQGTTIAIVQ